MVSLNRPYRFNFFLKFSSINLTWLILQYFVPDMPLGKNGVEVTQHYQKQSQMQISLIIFQVMLILLIFKYLIPPF